MSKYFEETSEFQAYIDQILWDNKCLRATGTQFQQLFEEVAKRLWPGFTKVNPHGKEGDWKCDG